MLTNSQLNRVQELINVIIDCEKQLEEIRFTLCQNSLFSMKPIFARFDQSKRGTMDSADILSFCQDNDLQVTAVEAYLMIKWFDKNKDGKVTFDDLIESLLPKKDTRKRIATALREPYFMWQNQQLPTVIESGMANFLFVLLTHLREQSHIKRQLLSQDTFNVFNVQFMIDQTNKGYVDYESIVTFIEENKLEVSIEDLTYFFMYADLNKDGMISHQEFIEILMNSTPPTEDIDPIVSVQSKKLGPHHYQESNNYYNFSKKKVGQQNSELKEFRSTTPELTRPNLYDRQNEKYLRTEKKVNRNKVEENFTNLQTVQKEVRTQYTNKQQPFPPSQIKPEQSFGDKEVDEEIVQQLLKPQFNKSNSENKSPQKLVYKGYDLNFNNDNAWNPSTQQPVQSARQEFNSNIKSQESKFDKNKASYIDNDTKQEPLGPRQFESSSQKVVQSQLKPINEADKSAERGAQYQNSVIKRISQENTSPQQQYTDFSMSNFIDKDSYQSNPPYKDYKPIRAAEENTPGRQQDIQQTFESYKQRQLQDKSPVKTVETQNKNGYYVTRLTQESTTSSQYGRKLNPQQNEPKQYIKEIQQEYSNENLNDNEYDYLNDLVERTEKDFRQARSTHEEQKPYSYYSKKVETYTTPVRSAKYVNNQLDYTPESIHISQLKQNSQLKSEVSLSKEVLVKGEFNQSKVSSYTPDRSKTEKKDQISPAKIQQKVDPQDYNEYMTQLKKGQSPVQSLQFTPLRGDQSDTRQTNTKGDIQNKPSYPLFRLLLKEVLLEREIEEHKRQLSLKQDFNLLDAFRIFDHQGAGRTNRDYLSQGLEDIGIKFNQNQVQLLLKQYSKRKDGQLTYSDFTRMLLPGTADYSVMLQNRAPTFKQFNDAKELYSQTTLNFVRALLTSLLTSEETIDKYRSSIQETPERLFNTMDQSGKGYLDEEDFRGLFSQNNVHPTALELRRVLTRFTLNNQIQQVDLQAFTAQIK